jgi:hypothetical protein
VLLARGWCVVVFARLCVRGVRAELLSGLRHSGRGK